MSSRAHIKIFHAVLLCTVVLGSSKEGTYPGDQLHHTEWLRNIIICTAVQAYHGVKLTAFCGKHDYRKFPDIRTDTDFL